MMLATSLRAECNRLAQNDRDQRIITTTSRVVLTVEYDGTDYCGFQFQVNQPTIQDELEKAIYRLTGEKRRVVGASRTDAGVHAMNQVAAFRTGSLLQIKAFVDGLNYYLPQTIAVKSAFRAGEEFHVQKSAASRQYDYYILNRAARSPLRDRFTYLVREPLNIQVMDEAAQVLVGEHDLASFTSGDLAAVKTTVRRVFQACVKRVDDLVVFTIVANSFMPHQIRNTVGTLVLVGLGKMGVAEFNGMMERKTPGLAGPKAPASGLHLVQVNYPDPIKEETNEDV